MKLDIKLLAVGLALIVGLAFELFKVNPGKSLSKSPRIALSQEIQPYSMNSQRLAQQQARAQAIQPIHNSHTFAKMAGPANLPEVAIETAKTENKEEKKEESNGEKKEEEKKVTEADEFEDVIDPKTGQVVRRKKAKTEEEKLKQEEEEKLAKLKEENEENEKRLKAQIETEKAKQAALRKQQEEAQHPTAPAGGALAQQPYTGGGGGGFSANAYLSAAEWEKKLLTNPSLSATTGFIQSYLNGSVSSRVFYSVVETMLKDNRAEVRGYGVLALGSTPSAMSFNELAALLKTEPASSAIRPKIDEYLNQYTELKNLDVLANVMNASTSAFNVVMAISKVDASAQKYISNKADPSYARNVAYFKPFISILESLSKSSDASIMAQAQNTLADLKSLTSST